MKRLVSIAVVMILLSSMILVATPRTIATPIMPEYKAIDYKTSQAGLTFMPTPSPEDLAGMPAGMQEVGAFVTAPAVGTKAYDWYLYAISRGTATGTQPYMTLRAISGNVEVWTQDYLWFYPGDPRNADPNNLLITDAMCQFVADEFDSTIYPTDTSFFGLPADRDGTNTIFQRSGYPSYFWNWIATDNPQRVILKILNIRDTNYVDPTYPYYTAGFFSPTYDAYYNRNMIQIDAWRWWQRLGALGTEWVPGLFVNRPFVYDATIAHEYQHLIHADWNPDDPSFMNEGCSMYAEYLCGFGIDPSYFNSYLYTPDNSLSVWGDQGDINILADYGAAALWAIYLSDHYGGAAFLSHFVEAGIPGIDGVNAALAYFGYTATFDTVYHDWRIANLIRSDSPGGGLYNYKSINLNDPSIIPAFTHVIEQFPVPLTDAATGFGDTYTILGYDTGFSKLGPYGSDYIQMAAEQMGLIGFFGEQAVLYGWEQQTDGTWWSGTSEDLIDFKLLSQAYVNPADPTLTLVTKWGIESFWDFGFVQVSTDGGNTWTSLSNAYTSSEHDPSALGAIVANLPGLTDYNPSWPDFDTILFDLSAYEGQTIMIDFRYMTDWATTFEGWYIQSATVSGTPLTMQAVYPQANWQVSVVNAMYLNGKLTYTVNDVILSSANTGVKGTNFAKLQYAILVASYVTPVGFSDYKFQATAVPTRGAIPPS